MRGVAAHLGQDPLDPGLSVAVDAVKRGSVDGAPNVFPPDPVWGCSQEGTTAKRDGRSRRDGVRQ